MIVSYPNDFLLYSMIIVLITCHPHMFHLLFKQNGISQNMSTFHWIPYVIWIGYAVYRLNTMDNTFTNDLLFNFTLITVITNSICVILDLWACYN